MKKILLVPAVCGIIICGAVGLTACGGGAEYSIECQSSENGYVFVADTEVKAGEKVILAAHPNAGYRLTSFLLDGEAIDGVSFVMPQKDVTVSAQFEVVTYSITYVYGDTTAVGNNPDSYTAENAAELIAPEKEGYEICGWYRYCTEPEYNYNWDVEDFRVTTLEGLFGNLTLYAKYYNPPHEIHVADDGNGWCYVADYGDEAYYGETYRVTVEPSTGYELDYIAVNGTSIDGTSFTMPAGDAEVTAIFKPIEYQISYVLFGGENSPENPTSFTVEDGYVYLSDATKDGYFFIGWFADEEFTQPIYGGISAYDYLDEPLTLYAYFIAEDEEYD